MGTIVTQLILVNFTLWRFHSLFSACLPIGSQVTLGPLWMDAGFVGSYTYTVCLKEKNIKSQTFRAPPRALEEAHTHWEAPRLKLHWLPGKSVYESSPDHSWNQSRFRKFWSRGGGWRWEWDQWSSISQISANSISFSSMQDWDKKTMSLMSRHTGWNVLSNICSNLGALH